MMNFYRYQTLDHMFKGSRHLTPRTYNTYKLQQETFILIILSPSLNISPYEKKKRLSLNISPLQITRYIYFFPPK